jgi:hypothetical protein
VTGMARKLLLLNLYFSKRLTTILECLMRSSST